MAQTWKKRQHLANQTNELIDQLVEMRDNYSAKDFRRSDINAELEEIQHDVNHFRHRLTILLDGE